jgi:hypothetical protein
MSFVSPEDQPDQIWIGPVGPIPMHYDDDPRTASEREAWHTATGVAQALSSPQGLLEGMSHPDWRVRHEVVDRLVAKGRSDPRTLPALLGCLASDPSAAVRDKVGMAMTRFPDDDRVVPALRGALDDPDDDVRWSATYALTQLGFAPS